MIFQSPFVAYSIQLVVTSRSVLASIVREKSIVQEESRARPIDYFSN